MKARNLAEGDLITLQGRTWEVVSNVAKGDQVMLTIVNSDRRTFSKAVAGDRKFDASRPRMSEARRAEVWAEANGARPRMVTTDQGPDIDGAANVRDILGGVEMYRTIAGVTTVQTPTPTTLAAHLLTFHGVTWAGVTQEEARLHGSTVRGLSEKTGKRTGASYDEPVAERTSSPEAAAEAADWGAMSALHDRLHEMGEMPNPHVHADLTPKD